MKIAIRTKYVESGTGATEAAEGEATKEGLWAAEIAEGQEQIVYRR